jgi:hypothetical protein
VRCPACGKNVRAKRRVPHPETAECLIRVTAQRYAARGWLTCENKVQAELLSKAGGSVEMAPGRIDFKRLELTDAKGRKTYPYARDAEGRMVEYAEDRPYAPKEQIRAYQIISGISFEKARRVEILRELLVNVELREAARSVYDLADRSKRSDRVRAFLNRMFFDKKLRLELKAGLEELEAADG